MIVLPEFCPDWYRVDGRTAAEQRAYIASELRRIDAEGAPLLTVCVAYLQDDRVQQIAHELISRNYDSDTGEQIFAPREWRLKLVDGGKPPTVDPQGRQLSAAEAGKVLVAKVGVLGGELGPGWLLKNQLTAPDLLLAAGFSYQVITAHNGCLQMEVTVHGKMAHAAIPDTGIDALQGATAILNALYQQNRLYQAVTSQVEGISHPYLNVGRIEGGTNTNVVPGKVTLKLDRRMIPEENPAQVEADVRRVILEAAASVPGMVSVPLAVIVWLA